MMFSKGSNLFRKTDSLISQCFGVDPVIEGDSNPSTKLPKNNEPMLDVSGWSTGPNDTVHVIDVSGSMGTEDCMGTRLSACKRAAKEYCNQRLSKSSSDRVAVIEFDTQGRVILPLTEIVRIECITRAIDCLGIQGGTDLAAGLRAAIKVFAKGGFARKSSAAYKRLVLLTDGNGGHPIKLARQLKYDRVLIQVVGFGATPFEVNEALLRKVATTDSTGFTHYRFFKDSHNLVKHYKELATGIVFKGRGE